MSQFSRMGSDSVVLPSLMDMSIEDILRGFASGSFSSYDLVSTYLARIRQINSVLNAVAEINPDALEIAKQCDEERQEGQSRGCLHGVPILYKDAFLTSDKMQNTVGSTALKGSMANLEATVISRLKASGAIMLGTTTLTEWSNLRTKESPHGWSASWGQCHGAYYPQQDPGGSSSGSAVAVAVGLGAAALGTETWGSITMPCQKSAVVGIKPTPGRVSRDGMFVVNEYQDTPGPIARTVKDAALLLQVMAEARSPAEVIPDYVAAATPGRLEGYKIAAPWHIINQDDEVVSSFKHGLETLRSLGAIVLTDIEFPQWTTSSRKENADLLDLAFRVLVKKNIETFLGNLSHNPYGLKTLSDLVEYHRVTPDEKGAEYGVTEFEAADQIPYTEESREFKESLEKREDFGREIERLLDAHGCDAIVVPGSGDMPSDMGGNPAVIVPLGFYSKDKAINIQRNNMVYQGPKIPFGMMFIGRRFREATLIKLAAAYDFAAMTRKRVRPCIQSNIELDVGASSATMKV